MPIPRPRPQRGDFPSGIRRYSSSELDMPLLWFSTPQADSRGSLIIADTHDDENSSIVALSCTLRTPRPELRRHHVVLMVSPDGCQLGLRANAHGAGLSRNFPAASRKQEGTVYRQSSAAEGHDAVPLTGGQPGSGREIQVLCQSIHQIHPAWVVSFYDLLACIEDPGHSPLGHWLADAFSLPPMDSVGHDMPGSFGSRYADIGLPCITAEFPSVSVDEVVKRYLPTMTDLLRWQV